MRERSVSAVNSAYSWCTYRYEANILRGRARPEGSRSIVEIRLIPAERKSVDTCPSAEMLQCFIKCGVFPAADPGNCVHGTQSAHRGGPHTKAQQGNRQWGGLAGLKFRTSGALIASETDSVCT